MRRVDGPPRFGSSNLPKMSFIAVTVAVLFLVAFAAERGSMEALLVAILSIPSAIEIADRYIDRQSRGGERDS